MFGEKPKNQDKPIQFGTPGQHTKNLDRYGLQILMQLFDTLQVIHL